MKIRIAILAACAGAFLGGISVPTKALANYSTKGQCMRNLEAGETTCCNNGGQGWYGHAGSCDHALAVKKLKNDVKNTKKGTDLPQAAAPAK
jgi:hypothetical protein